MKVDVWVTNRIAYLQEEFPEALEEYWSFAHPKWNFVMRNKTYYLRCKYCRMWERQHTGKENHRYKAYWDGRIHFMNGNRLPAGLFWATRKEIEKDTNIKFRVRGELVCPEKKSNGVVNSERDYQNNCVARMLKTLKFGGGLILNATGSGKTFIAAMLFSRLEGMACFIVDQLILLEQAKKELESRLGERVGYVGDSEFEPQRVTVATRQTMSLHSENPKFKKWTKQLDVMIVDEIHEQMNHSNFKVVEKIRPKAVFGLTATLQLRKKSVRLKAYALCGPVVFSYPLEQGQREGVLSQGIGVRVLYPNPIDILVQRSLGWPQTYSQYVVSNPERNWLLADMIRASHGRGKYVICLVTRLKHLDELSQRLKMPHRIVSGTFQGKSIKVEDRILAKNKFEKGKVRVILANTVFKKGVDIKRVDVIIDGAAGRNENDPIQKFGRGIRLHKEKTGLLYFDVNDVDERNEENWFGIAAKYRTRSLKRAGIELHAYNWSEDSDGDTVLDMAEGWLRKRLDNV